MDMEQDLGTGTELDGKWQSAFLHVGDAGFRYKICFKSTELRYPRKPSKACFTSFNLCSSLFD